METKLTLIGAKRIKTQQEMKRVYDGMNTPEDIILWFDGKIYSRKAWRSGRMFGWGKWVEL